MLFNRAPSYSHIRSSGYLAYAHDNKILKNKFRSRGRKSVFLGYPYGRKGWMFFDLDTQDFSVLGILCF